MAVAFHIAIETRGGSAGLNNFVKRNVLCGRRRDELWMMVQRGTPDSFSQTQKESALVPATTSFRGC
jgi:hypothetical protein